MKNKVPYPKIINNNNFFQGYLISLQSDLNDSFLKHVMIFYYPGVDFLTLMAAIYFQIFFRILGNFIFFVNQIVLQVLPSPL